MSEFWDWALAAYDRPGVAEACLALQDDHGQQTGYLLWAAWADPPTITLAAGAALARRWEAEVLGPIRAARRAMKTATPPVPEDRRLAVREEVKRVELAVERLLMETLAGLAQASGPVDRADALARAGQAWGDPPPDSALADLARRLA